MALEKREVPDVRLPEDVPDRTSNRHDADERIQQRVPEHPHQDDLRHPLVEPLNDQQRGKDRTREIADAGDERQERVDAEPDLRSGDPEPGVEQHGPRAKPRERDIRSNGAAGHVRSVSRGSGRRNSRPRRAARTLCSGMIKLVPGSAPAPRRLSAPRSTDPGSISRCSRRTPRRLSSAFSIGPTRSSSTPAFRSPSAPTRSGMATYRISARASSTGTAYTDHGIRRVGHRFNPTKLVLDPYARQLGRALRWNAVLLSARTAGESEASPGTADSAPFAPLAMVPDPDAARAFEWRGDSAPRTPWRDTLIYELHVKGFTALNNAIPAHLRGTYLGVASEPSIDHLKALGVTAVELMPIQTRADEWRLVRAGLVNYWGYNTLAFFAPDHRFATDRSPVRAVDEFKAMVRELHRRRARSDSRRGLQPHSRGRRNGPHAFVPRHRQRELLPPRSPPAGAIPELRGHRKYARHALPSCARSSSWTACGIGSKTCTWTDSGSISRPCSRASPTRSIPPRGSVRRCCRIPCSRA